MTGPHHVSRQNRLGGYNPKPQRFSWKGKTWKLRFQATVKDARTPTTHGFITGKDERPKRGASQGEALSSVLKATEIIREKLKAARERIGPGWQFEKLPTGVSAVFDPEGLIELPSKAIGSSATFNIEVGGTLYWCQFDVYAATALWDGRLRAVEVEVVDTEPLLGMSLLDHHSLLIEVVTGGAVTVTAFQ